MGIIQIQLQKQLRLLKDQKKPTLISCKTKIGFGSPNKEGKSSAHGSPLGTDEIKLTRKTLNWPNAPFQIPIKVLNQWRACSKLGKGEFKKWKQIFTKISSKQKNRI
jgi:transketolase